MKTCKSCNKEFDPEDQAHGEDNEGNFFCEECCETFTDYNAWGLFQTYPTEWHIFPINEVHIQDGTICSCNPQEEMEGSINIVTHNSFDGREALDEAYKILNPN